MNIELRDIDQVRPYPGNPRQNDEAVDAVAASLREFGFRQPIVVDGEGVIIVGHTRWKAAKKLGLAKVPVHVATDLRESQVKAYRIADNQTAAIAEWDYELLPIELSSLQEMDFDLNLLGFDQEELARLMSGDVQQGLTDPDDVPAPPDAATTQPGDLWILGNHRLLCGDSSKAEDVNRLLEGATIHLCNTDPPYNVRVEPRSNNGIAAGLSSFPASDAIEAAVNRLLEGATIHLCNTDPPYNVRVEPRSNNAIAAGLSSFPASNAIEAADARGMHHQGFDLARHKSKAHATHKKLRAKDRPLVNDFVSDEEFDRLLEAWFSNIARVLAPGRSFYIWGGYANCANYPPVLKRCELYFSQAIIWVKEHPVLTRKDFMGNHEWCFYGWREGAAHKFYGPSNVSDVWSVKKVNPQSMVHLTEKPVELAVRAIQYSSLAGENVLDLFGGSGSTLIAAEQTGRNAYLMELDPLYCDVIVQRWEKFTGKKARRISGDEVTDSTEKTPAMMAGVDEAE